MKSGAIDTLAVKASDPADGYVPGYPTMGATRPDIML